ncbi:MAG TPA: hypothetical protein VN937_11025 [Blastocatellia bacterium]|nr:hypothetical protein [Blastocatellia bacterium]
MPVGIHWATRADLALRFGWTPHRRKLLVGITALIGTLQKAGCRSVYIDGSFVTAKQVPGDFDACWSVADVDVELIDPVLFEFDNERAAQKAKYFGDIFPAELPEGLSGRTFLDFFQIDKVTGKRKGIVGIRLRRRKQ